MMKTKINRGDCVLVRHFGPLYVVDSFRNGPDATGYRWTEYCGINGQDGVSYQFEIGDVERKLTRDEFDRMPKSAHYPDQIDAAN